jgi:hypothetical protein
MVGGLFFSWVIDRWRVRSLSRRCALRKPRCPLMSRPCVALLGYLSVATFSTCVPLFPKGNLVGGLLVGRMKCGASRWVGHPSPSSMLFSAVLVGERGLRGRSLLVPVGRAMECHGSRVYTSIVRMCARFLPGCLVHRGDCSAPRGPLAGWFWVCGQKLKRNDSRQRISRLSLR